MGSGSETDKYYKYDVNCEVPRCDGLMILHKAAHKDPKTSRYYNYILDAPLNALGLPVRAVNGFENNEKFGPILTVGQLLNMSPDDIMSIANFGKKTVEQSLAALNSKGLTLSRAPLKHGPPKLENVRVEPDILGTEHDPLHQEVRVWISTPQCSPSCQSEHQLPSDDV